MLPAPSLPRAAPLALALLAASGPALSVTPAPVPPRAPQDPAPPPPPSPWPEPWPDVAPFASLPGWSRVALPAYGVPDLARALDDARRALEAAAAVRAATPAAEARAADARLGAPLAPAERAWWWLVPPLVERLGPLADPGREWSEEDLEVAELAAAHFAGRGVGLELHVSAEAEDEANRAELAALGAWFRGASAEPALHAAMCPCLGDGPFAGLPGPDEERPALAVLPLGPHLVLELARLAEPAPPLASPEPWVLQVRARGALVDARVLSGAPGPPLRSVAFSREAPRHLGAHGARVRLVGVRGGAPVSILLHLAPDGRILFYWLER